jgi:predicted metal-dependent phosphoesterase TrpH
MVGRAFIDLHCHTARSFDSLASPAAVVRVAADRGLTHLAVTDHDTIVGALEARAAAPDGLTVIIGEEIRTADGDLIALFLSEAVPSGHSALATIERVRDQGGLVGIPHPYDRWRGSMFRDARLEVIAQSVDWIEAHNARIVSGDGNERAAAFALAHELPGVAVSDSHSLLEIGVAYTILQGDPATADGLKAALAGPIELVPGRASYFVRSLTPIAKVINRLRGRGRVAPVR